MVQNRAKVYYGGQLCKCEYMSDNEVNEGTVRVSLRIPARMVDRIDEIRGPYRDRTSMILERSDRSLP